MALPWRARTKHCPPCCLLRSCSLPSSICMHDYHIRHLACTRIVMQSSYTTKNKKTQKKQPTLVGLWLLGLKLPATWPSGCPITRSLLPPSPLSHFSFFFLFAYDAGVWHCVYVCVFVCLQFTNCFYARSRSALRKTATFVAVPFTVLLLLCWLRPCLHNYKKIEKHKTRKNRSQQHVDYASPLTSLPACSCSCLHFN